MIEALKELVAMVKDLPEFALWILIGFLFYKLFVIGSIYSVIRLGINKFAEYLKGKNTAVTIKAVKLGDFVFTEETGAQLGEVLDTLSKYHDAQVQIQMENDEDYQKATEEQKAVMRKFHVQQLFYGGGGKWLDERGVLWLRDAVREKISKETGIKEER